MPTVVNFNGKKIIEPGVYAQIKSGIPAKPSNSSFGDLVLIDTGKSGKEWGGGSGINGEFANGVNSVYGFQDVDDFKQFNKGGLFYDLADYIFNPINGAVGPDTVYMVRACTTTPASISYNFPTGANGGSLSFLCKNEGEVGNGWTNETLATATLRIVNAIVIGNVFNVTVGGANVGTFTADSVSVSQTLASIAAAVSANVAGYKAKVQGSSIVVNSKKNTAVIVGPMSVVELLKVAVVETTTSFSGYVAGTQVATGYGSTLRIGDEDPLKYILSIYEGTFAGYNENGSSINQLTATQSAPVLVTESVEFSNIDTLIQWMLNDFTFNKLFEIDPDYVIRGTGVIASGDFTTNDDLKLASGGTSVYNSTDLDKVLEDVRELQNTFFLTDCYGDDAKGTENLKVVNAIQTNSEFDRFLVIGGGKDETKFDVDTNSSIEIAKFYNSTSVIVVHSGETRFNSFTNKKEKMSSIYHAACFVGRLGGLEPQVPATFKALKIQEFNHPLGLKQREKALKYGVIHNRTVPGIGNVTNQAINTLQNNSQLVNPDGSSPEISIMRIGAQLNKELILNMRPLFVGNNWGKASPADVKTYVEGYLFGRTVTTNEDNLILSFKNVTVRLIEDYYDIKYGFVPNGPLNKLFVTGFMLDNNLNA